MSRRVVLPVLVWSISAVGAEERPADPLVIELPVVTVTATNAMTSEPLTSVPPDKLVVTLGLRLPELGLVFTGPRPLGVLLYPRTAVALVGDRSV